MPGFIAVVLSLLEGEFGASALPVIPQLDPGMPAKFRPPTAVDPIQL
jgi:hypothetical protein